MSGSPKFLIVEDDIAVARAVARALRPRPAVIAISARKALSFLDDNPGNPLIIDVRLPDGSGFDVLDRARAHDPLVDALMMSGEASFVNRAFEDNVHFIQKPVGAPLIVAFAERVEERNRARRARVAVRLNVWTNTFHLTPSEREVLHTVTIIGVARKDLAERLAKSEETIKTQVHRLLAKTEHQTLLDAALALLRESVE
ncbi:MAG: response regulator transcription factor [Polyangiaceae bacterium]